MHPLLRRTYIQTHINTEPKSLINPSDSAVVLMSNPETDGYTIQAIGFS